MNVRGAVNRAVPSIAFAARAAVSAPRVIALTGQMNAHVAAGFALQGVRAAAASPILRPLWAGNTRLPRAAQASDPRRPLPHRPQSSISSLPDQYMDYLQAAPISPGGAPASAPRDADMPPPDAHIAGSLEQPQITRIAHVCTRRLQWALHMAGMGLETIAFVSRDTTQSAFERLQRHSAPGASRSDRFSVRCEFAPGEVAGEGIVRYKDSLRSDMPARRSQRQVGVERKNARMVPLPHRRSTREQTFERITVHILY